MISQLALIYAVVQSLNHACGALLTTDPQRQDLGRGWIWILPVLQDESTDVKQVRNRNMHFLNTGARLETLSHQELPFRQVEETYTDLATFHNNLSDEEVSRLSRVWETQAEFSSVGPRFFRTLDPSRADGCVEGMRANGELAPLEVEAHTDAFAVLFRFHGNRTIENAIDNAVQGLQHGLFLIRFFQKEDNSSHKSITERADYLLTAEAYAKRQFIFEPGGVLTEI